MATYYAPHNALYDLQGDWSLEMEALSALLLGMGIAVTFFVAQSRRLVGGM